MRAVRIAAATLVSLAALTALARADGVPNIIGTWKGTAYAVQVGPTPYRQSDTLAPKFPDAGMEFTYEITEQHDNRFAGTMRGGKFAETIIGAISPDNVSGVMLDDDGDYTFTFADANTLNLCYRHSYPLSRVVACWQAKRS